jgi:hypothetical protein
MNEMKKILKLNKINNRAGGPFDRGDADRYYGRPYTPHFFTDGTYVSDKVEEKNMTAQEISEYAAGFNSEGPTKN